MFIRTLFLGAVLAAISPAAPIYTVHDLGTFGGSSATAYAVNNAGVAVGAFYEGPGYGHAFSGQSALSPGSYGSAAAINDAGAIAGTVLVNGVAQATVWRNGAATSIGQANSYAMGINDAGEVTGSINGRAFVTQNGNILDLGTFTGGYEASGYSVNDNGQVAGYGMRSNGTFQAFLWSQATGLAAIPGLGGANSYALSVNEGGVVAGTAQTRAGYFHAFLYSDGRTQDLGTLGGATSFGQAINAAGDIVGSSSTGSASTGSSSVTHAFLYRNGAMYDLNALIAAQGWILTAAYGINDQGQIVGTGLFGGEQRAFLLDRLAVLSPGPADFAAAPSEVPEPSTTVMFLLPVAALLLSRTELISTIRRSSGVRQKRERPT